MYDEMEICHSDVQMIVSFLGYSSRVIDGMRMDSQSANKARMMRLLRKKLERRISATMAGKEKQYDKI